MSGEPEPDAGPAVPPRIVDAASHVIEQDGPAAATLERIAQAAGVSRMTLHRRGVSKEAILAALAERLELGYREALWPALVAQGSGRERLEQALAALCAVTEAHRATLRALSAGARNEIYHEAGAGGLTRATFTEPLQRLLADGRIDGSLADVDARETATLLFNAVTHTYAHMRDGHGWTEERAAQGVVRLVIDGLAVV